MTVFRESVKLVSRFHSISLTTTPHRDGWTIKDTSSAGTPTYTSVTAEDGGALKMLCSSTSEEQILTMYWNDILSLPLVDMHNISFLVKVAGMDAVTDLVVGLGAAQNDTEDSVVTNAWFKMDGSDSTTAVVVETDDATNNNDDIATGKTLAAVYKEVKIDFTYGLADVRFYFDGAPVARGTTFDMSDLTAGLNAQPYIQLHKASGTGVPAVSIARFECNYNIGLGA